MIALLGSSLLNLGIIFLIFSVIIYIVKNKLSDMDKKITSLSSIMEETIKTINAQNTISRESPSCVKLEKPVVSDDEDSDDDDESCNQFCANDINNDSDNDSDDDDDDCTQLTQDIEKPLLNEVNLLQSNPDVDPVLGMAFQSYDSIDDNITAQSHADEFKNTPEPGVFKEKEKEEDYNLLNVKELKKIVSGKGGKVSGKTKDELVLYLNENKE
tara:strand:- start:127 stop:768 length:642 start_codon:yes stop_codon:yes gene_type:complete